MRPPIAVGVAYPNTQQDASNVAIAGVIRARVQTSVSFNTSGQVTAREVEVGQHVAADTVLALLDPASQQDDLNNLEAALASARAQLQQAALTFGRQRALISSGFTTRPDFDQAQETLSTTQAQVRDAEAAVNTARAQLSYTTLKAGRSGVIVSRSVETGQVVQTGQTVFVLAEDGPRDAVFNVPEALLTAPPVDRTVDIALQSDPAVHAKGILREISPILDAASDTIVIKAGIEATPPRMTLGAAVVGRAHLRQERVLVLPWSALFELQGGPAVWIVSPTDTVSLHPVQVRRYETDLVYIAGGLDTDQRVVTAGGQLLYPGERVRPVQGVVP